NPHGGGPQSPGCEAEPVLECVVNISEGRDLQVIDAIAAAAGRDLLDVHIDADHHRSVLTLVGTDAVRSVAREAVARLDLRDHVQVSVNLVDPAAVGRAEVTDAVAARADVARCELVGLVPAWVVRSTPIERWGSLDLAPDRTIEARLAAAGR